MADNTVPITAQVLAWTREEAGLTQVELAESASWQWNRFKPGRPRSRVPQKASSAS